MRGRDHWPRINERRGTAQMHDTGTVAALDIVAGSMIERRYVLRARIGSNTTADLWHAADLRLQRDVAIKLRRPDVGPAEVMLADANALAGVSHPALVTVFDAGMHAGPGGPRAYVVTELIDGHSLQARLKWAALPARRIARIGSQVADALAHLHRVGCAHGAVSVDNIVLRPDGTAKLADFGAHVGAGDPSPADDVRALGAVLLAAFAGPTDVPAGSRSAARRAWLRRRTATTRLGQPRGSAWLDLLQAMLADDPSVRPSSADVAGRLAGLAVAAVAETRERDEPSDVNDDLAPLSIGHWRAPDARVGSSRSRVRLRRGRHRRAVAVDSAHRDGDGAAA